jgi:predicted nucleotidyltransferase
MLKNTQINKDIIKTVANGLAELSDKVIYVGGAVVSLYINDPAAEDVRPTKDIDISLEIASLGELETLRQDLQRKGFKQTFEDDVICRFRYKNIKVDVMSTKAIGWAPANPWFKDGFKNRIPYEIADQQIFIMPLPYFLAAKFAAYHDRGEKDPRTSQDIEDIVYILDNNSDIVEIIDNASSEVLDYLRNEFKGFLDIPAMKEAILGNLNPAIQTERYQLIIEKLSRIVSGNSKN